MAARRRVIVAWLAVAVLVVGIVIALLLPMYTCEWGHLETFEIAGRTEITCIQSDLGYQPSSWLPTKVAFAAGGLAIGTAILLRSRRHPLAGLAVVVLFVAITTAWFLPDGSRPPRAGEVGVPHTVNRYDVRVGVVSIGAVAALVFLVLDLPRTPRGRSPAKT